MASTQIPRKGDPCNECGRPMFRGFWMLDPYWLNELVYGKVFCSEGCKDRFQSRLKEREREQKREQEREQERFAQEQNEREQAKQQIAREEAQQQELLAQRIMMMKRDPRFKEIEVMGGLFNSSDVELLKDYMNQYGDPLQNPSLSAPQQPNTRPEPEKKESSGTGTFFDSHDEAQRKTYITLFQRTAQSFQAEDMKKMLLEGKYPPGELCYHALQVLLPMAEKMTIPREVQVILATYGDIE